MTYKQTSKIYKPPYIKLNGDLHSLKQNLESILKSWTPFSCATINYPHTGRNLPLCANARVRNVLARNYIEKCNKVIVFQLLYLAFALSVHLFAGYESFLNVAVLVCLLLTVTLVERTLIYQNNDNLLDKEIYLTCLINKGKIKFFYSLGFFASLWMVQVLLSSDKSLEYVVSKYGLNYSSILTYFDFWRFLSGPFIHYDFIHWLNNAALACVFINISGSQLRSYSLLLVGAVLSGILEFSVNLNNSNAFVGISGGVYAIAGYMVFDFITSRENYPNSFKFNILFLLLFTSVFSALFVKNVAVAAHLFGFVLGAAVNLFCYFFKNDFQKNKKIKK